ncbi:ATP-grasp domain-containing protein [Saccharibacillus qingshengii]|uniref:ATP-grasp domain-containing protein n=1 Tax=Saccharibacillus qingshengii TaxID=1763540 RepID=UPI001557E1E1|nr:ATP-grasp domain-containing protein [Saccharibacillus qingshengii]
MTLTVLFAASPLNLKEVDDSYADEYRCAQAAGLFVGLIDLDPLLLGASPQQAVKRLSRPDSCEPGPALYRGWMLRPGDYTRLYEALLTRNLRLINSPQHYMHTHYLPESYPKIEGVTPESVWFPVRDRTAVEEAGSRAVEAVRRFGDRPIIVKDYVKSRKHEWTEACYIPDASDQGRVRQTVRRLLELQGAEFSEGLVFRAFEELEALSLHPQSGMPLSREIRVFVLDGEPVFVSTYWEAGEDAAFNERLGEFEEIIRSVESRFFTIDFAKTKKGPWIVLELGDGQVAGLPDDTPPALFYGKLKQQWDSTDQPIDGS